MSGGPAGEGGPLAGGPALPAGVPLQEALDLACAAWGAAHLTLRVAAGDEELVLVSGAAAAEATVVEVALPCRSGALGKLAAVGAGSPGAVEALAAWIAPRAELARLQREQARLRRQLALRSFQLETLIELDRELSRRLDEEALRDVLLPSLMGQLAVARCGLCVTAPVGLHPVATRGLRPQALAGLPARDLPGGETATRVAELPAGATRAAFEQERVELVVAARSASAQGWLLLGPRASGAGYGPEERELALTMARQGLTLVETVRLHRLRLEKQQQDRELALAREIQQNLFPRRLPRPAGFDLAALSRPCQAVGGDYYDFLELSGGRLGLVVADVSGKGTPASLLMASVHAAVRCLGGTLSPAGLLDRLNRQLLDSTQPHRYVTLFYAELDLVTGALTYVNGGHVPPLLRRRQGDIVALEAGGVAPGLIEEATYDVGRERLAPGDTLLLVTDGVTEALSAEERELGPEGLRQVLRESRATTAQELLEQLVARVESWAGPSGLADDLTAVVVRREA